MINDGDTVEVYVFHGVSEANQAPLELEFVPNVSDSGVGEESFNETSNPNNQPPTSTFPSNPKTGPSETSSTRFEDPPTIVPPLSPSSTVPPPSPSTVPLPSPSSTVPPPSPSTVTPPSCVPSSDPIIDNDPIDDEVEDESGSEGYNNEDTEVESDVHQEYIDIRESKSHFKGSQRRSRGTTSDQINVDEKGPNIGYDETNIGIRKSLVGTLGGDESYYLSDEAPSFEIDDKTGWGDGEEVDQVVHKPVRRKKTPNRVVFDEISEKVVWELGLVFRSVDEFKVAVTRYAVQEHIHIKKYVNEPGRVRDIIRKELDIHVGRTIVRRARTRVLQEIMGDHIVEYGVCKGQLLVTICRVGNNQMLPIAWAVVEVENQFTWTWFLELVRNDLDLGEGHQLSIITDMKKGLEIVV
ncbi:hypothetical protein KY285_010323 [Solanum tuberosum]|nr:hypothetical protein KY289_010871 [Solanum tuberosum]KAH0734616.1 hypothetical protein KY285_010323 [Solanum tuberosum]